MLKNLVVGAHRPPCFASSSIVLCFSSRRVVAAATAIQRRSLMDLALATAPPWRTATALRRRRWRGRNVNPGASVPLFHKNMTRDRSLR